MAQSRKPNGFPTEHEILDFVKTSDGRNTKREISRAFGIKGPDKVQLKKLLREMIAGGLLIQESSKALRPADQLAPVQVLEFLKTDKDGDVLLHPVNWADGIPSPTIYLTSTKDRRKGAGIGPGDQLLGRLSITSEEPLTYRATVIKLLKSEKITEILGIFHGNDQGGRIHPVDKKNRDELIIAKEHINKAEDGELVLVEILQSKHSRRIQGLKPARVRERLGDVTAPKAISTIAIHAYEIPDEFPVSVIAAAESAETVKLGKREDLRAIPLITIDPSDARDHDDAIWAEADTDPKNKDGFHAIVAIADVAHYVQPGSELDKEAYKRGNSCYFPDRVVSMLPEALSAGLCSLKPDEDRACMALHMWFDKDGKKLKHKFTRALMRSAANIEYKRVQAAIDGDIDTKIAHLVDDVLKPLYGAYHALCIARDKRQPLELDLPEKKIEIGDDGMVASITLRERLDAHRLVEEFMISANVCAAEELEKHHTSAMYRVHAEPSMDKMESLREFLRSLDMSLTKGTVTQPRMFNGILHQVKDSEYEIMVNQVVLRSQSQACYTPENEGHFGLALQRYAHFTSPIRRYADLIVHRGLIRALGFGGDGLTDKEIETMESIGEHISETERRAMTAERDSTDRYLAAYLSTKIGEEMKGRISGVTRFGLFVTLDGSGGDGLILISDLGGDYYTHDEDHHQLVGDRSGHTFRLGDILDVKITEANKYTGGIRLELAGETADNLPNVGFKGRRKGSSGRGGPKRSKSSSWSSKSSSGPSKGSATGTQARPKSEAESDKSKSFNKKGRRR